MCGCAACCGKAQGWKWHDVTRTRFPQGDEVEDREWRWRGCATTRSKHASMAHVLLECKGVEGAAREREVMGDMVRRVRAVVTRRGSTRKGRDGQVARTWVVEEGRREVVATHTPSSLPPPPAPRTSGRDCRSYPVGRARP